MATRIVLKVSFFSFRLLCAYSYHIKQACVMRFKIGIVTIVSVEIELMQNI